MNIFEVLNLGPIVAQDEELGILVTVNGAYFNVWVQRPPYQPTGRYSYDNWENVEAYDAASRVGDDDRGQWRLWDDVVTAAENLLDDIRNGDDEDEWEGQSEGYGACGVLGCEDCT